MRAGAVQVMPFDDFKWEGTTAKTPNNTGLVP